MRLDCYLVTYDISSPKRWRRIFELMHGYGEHVQLSVFRCDLDRRRRIELELRLSELLHHGEDQVILARLGPTSDRVLERITVLGRPCDLRLPGPRVV